MMRLLPIFFFVLIVVTGIDVKASSAHPGRTAADGCHYCRTNCDQWGVPYHERHCHDGNPNAFPISEPQAEALIPTAPDEVLRLDYEGFTIWLDCSRRGAIKFRYGVEKDQLNLMRHHRFYRDDESLEVVVPEACQQTSTASYTHPGEPYDRGHLVPANHVDHSETAIRQSNYMTNILPQAANMNRGAWLLTEEIVECYRNIDSLLVIGGVIWGETPEDDFFETSHGVKTPDAFWKVVIGGQDRVIAWLIPNTADATRAQLDTYLVTVAELEEYTGETFPEVPEHARTEKLEHSWIIPIGCNKS